MYHVVHVADVLAADKQLANEVEFDLRKFEEQEKQQQKEQKSRNVAVSCHMIHIVTKSCVFVLNQL